MTTPNQLMHANSLQLVAIGGGGGVGQVLRGALPYFAHCTGIIAVTDTGRSTGLARALFGIPAPGDLRSTIAALAREPAGLLARLLQYRLPEGAVPELEGMAFGNLLLGALTQQVGDYAQAVEALGALVGTAARVLPVSTANTHLCAELADGTQVETELAVRGLNKPPLRRLFLKDPSAKAYGPALEAITQADLVVIGPGSLFTTVLATLLFEGMLEALRTTQGQVVYICNTTTQPGQTDGYSALNHVERLVELLGTGTLDVVLVNRSEHDCQLLKQYAADGVYLLRPDAAEVTQITALGVRPLVGHYAEQTSSKRTLPGKQDSIRHDPSVLGKTLATLVQHRDVPVA